MTAILQWNMRQPAVKAWVEHGGVFVHGPFDELSKACFGIYGEECEKMPYRYGSTIIPQGEAFCRYYGGKSVSDYIDGAGCCVAEYAGDILAEMTKDNRQKDKQDRPERFQGAVYAFGVQIGASYAAKNIPHVPYGYGNREMYPFVLSKTTLVEDILKKYLVPVSGICERGIETGVFENGMVIVNHRSEPYILPEKYQTSIYQYPPYRRDHTEILAGHSAVWVSKTS